MRSRWGLRTRLVVYPLLFAIVFLVVHVAAAPAHRLSGHPATLRGQLEQAKRQVAHDRRSATVRSQGWTLMSPLPAVVVVHRWWLRRDLAYVRQLERQLRQSSWMVRAFLCIHYNPRTGTGEGSWTDPDPPYYGGLQMDMRFQRTYGRALLRSKGTADHWTPMEQISVAIRAHRTRGFYPWPATARACGLI